MELIAPQKPKGFRKMSTVFGNGKNTNARNSRDIWEYLGVKTAYSRWIKRRIDLLGGVENLDFSIAKKGNGISTKFEGEDYIVKDDFAKHLGMLEKTKKGYEVRDYFIYMEKLARYLLVKQIVECEIDTQNRIKAKEVKIEKLESDLKRAKGDRLLTHKNGFISLRKFLKENDYIRIKEEDAWSYLVDEGYVENEYIKTLKRMLIDDSIGYQPAGNAPVFDPADLRVIFQPFELEKLW